MNIIIVDLCTDKVCGKYYQIPAEEWLKGMSTQTLKSCRPYSF